MRKDKKLETIPEMESHYGLSLTEVHDGIHYDPEHISPSEVDEILSEFALSTKIQIYNHRQQMLIVHACRIFKKDPSLRSQSGPKTRSSKQKKKSSARRRLPRSGARVTRSSAWPR